MKIIIQQKTGCGNPREQMKPLPGVLPWSPWRATLWVRVLWKQKTADRWTSWILWLRRISRWDVFWDVDGWLFFYFNVGWIFFFGGMFEGCHLMSCGSIVTKYLFLFFCFVFRVGDLMDEDRWGDCQKRSENWFDASWLRIALLKWFHIIGEVIMPSPKRVVQEGGLCYKLRTLPHNPNTSMIA